MAQTVFLVVADAEECERRILCAYHDRAAADKFREAANAWVAEQHKAPGFPKGPTGEMSLTEYGNYKMEQAQARRRWNSPFDPDQDFFYGAPEYSVIEVPLREGDS